MMKAVIASVFLGMSVAVLSFASAVAAPVYLSCAFVNSSGRSQIFNFMLDSSTKIFGVYVPASGSQRVEKGIFTAQTASLNEGTVAWEVDLSRHSVVRERRMIGEKDRGMCKVVTKQQSGFDL